MAGAPQAVGAAESEVRERHTGSLGGHHERGGNRVIGHCVKDETLSLCLGKLFPLNRALFVTSSHSGGTRNPIGQERRAEPASLHGGMHPRRGRLSLVPGALEPYKEKRPGKRTRWVRLEIDHFLLVGVLSKLNSLPSWIPCL